jgi:SepF-like predicted cell division protein (DUF552 family)
MIIFDYLCSANKISKPIKTRKEMKKKKQTKSEVKAEEVQQATVEQPEVTSEEQKQVPQQVANAEETVALPKYSSPTYKTGQLILSKDISLVDGDIEADAEVGRESLKNVVESFPTARFTRIAKTKAIVTAEEDDYSLLTTWLTNYFSVK